MSVQGLESGPTEKPRPSGQGATTERKAKLATYVQNVNRSFGALPVAEYRSPECPG